MNHPLRINPSNSNHSHQPGPPWRIESLAVDPVEYTKGKHLYRILVPSTHILLSFCIRIGAFDRSRVFGLVQVFQVPCIIVIGVRVQRANVDHCG